MTMPEAPPRPTRPPAAGLPMIALPAWQQRGVYASLGLLTLSGIVWLALHWLYLLNGQRPDFQPGMLPYKLWAMRVHAAAALISLVMVGSVMTQHIRLAWRLNKNRISGSLMVSALGLLAWTGYALGYVPEGLFRQWSTWLHWGAGVALPLVLAAHVLLGQRQRQNINKIVH